MSRYLNYSIKIHKATREKDKKRKNLLYLIRRSKLSHPNWRRRPWRREEIEIDLPTIRKKMRDYSVKFIPSIVAHE